NERSGVSTAAGKHRHPILQGAEKCSTSSCPAEFECDLIRERRYAGVEAAWARGRTGSRPPLLSGDKLRTARENPRADQLLPLTARGGVYEVGISIAAPSPALRRPHRQCLLRLSRAQPT